MLRHRFAKLISTFAFVTGWAGVSVGQTILAPGDLAIVGVNANNNCAPWPSQSDEFTFVLLKAITTNTVFFITDNGYERGYAGQWGDTEGVIRIQRTGAALPAGSTVNVNVN